MLGGLDTLDEGELTVGGRKVTGLSQEQRTDYRKEDVGFVFQFYNLIPDLTVEENPRITMVEQQAVRGRHGRQQSVSELS